MEEKLEYLKAQLMTMIDLVRSQVTLAHQAFLLLDKDYAREVLHYEARVNSLEMSIDRDCEYLLNRHRIQGGRLRFIISALKINIQLERIGDHADMMGRIVLQRDTKFPDDLLQQVQLQEMFHLVIMILNDATQGYNFEDVEVARGVFAKEARLREITARATPILVAYAEQHETDIALYLHLASYIQKMERIAELTKNITEETIYYLGRTVDKHSTKQTGKP